MNSSYFITLYIILFCNVIPFCLKKLTMGELLSRREEIMHVWYLVMECYLFWQ